MKNTINKTHISGFVYEHDLTLKVSGPSSKNPGTEFISGTLSIATDNACINIVPVHFTYVTATTAKGTENATFKTLKNIIDGVYGTVMSAGKENAAIVKIDSAIGLNEFYTDRNGKEELVSAKRNEGGFVHVISESELEADENARNTFEFDILITGVTRVEGDPDKSTNDKVTIKGAIFDFRKSLLPIDVSVTSEGGMNYFESLGVSQSNPVFTRVKGNQISETIVTKKVEESAFGEPSVREVRNTRKDFVITWANPTPYEWDDASTMTVAELNQAISDREVYLATMKQRQDEYKASKNNATVAAAPAKGAFNF